jgi:hypothetical protein
VDTDGQRRLLSPLSCKTLEREMGAWNGVCAILKYWKAKK